MGRVKEYITIQRAFVIHAMSLEKKYTKKCYLLMSGTHCIASKIFMRMLYMNNQLLKQFKEILTLDVTSRLFNLLKANIARTKSSISVLLIETLTANETLPHFLSQEIRQNDTLFMVEHEGFIGVLLTQSGEQEATAFLRRIFERYKEYDEGAMIHAHITDIRTSDVSLDAVIDAAVAKLKKQREPWFIYSNNAYQQPTQETVKVSVIEENPIFRQVLYAELERLQLKHFSLEIAVFADGYEFLQSDFYVSSHLHLVIVNDILPRKNGMAVVHHLRHMPNQRKFIIYMMTSRMSEMDMISAYKSGVDEYLVKPFNLRLFEAQIERTFERLWL